MCQAIISIFIFQTSVFSQINEFSIYFSDQSHSSSIYSKNQRETLTISFSLTYILLKSVSFSFSYNLMLNNYSYFPYIIHYLSPSYVPTFLSMILIKKERISSTKFVSPLIKFTESDTITESNLFTSSNLFTASNVFAQSDFFTSSNIISLNHH